MLIARSVQKSLTTFQFHSSAADVQWKWWTMFIRHSLVMWFVETKLVTSLHRIVRNTVMRHLTTQMHSDKRIIRRCRCHCEHVLTQTWILKLTTHLGYMV